MRKKNWVNNSIEGGKVNWKAMYECWIKQNKKKITIPHAMESKWRVGTTCVATVCSIQFAKTNAYTQRTYTMKWKIINLHLPENFRGFRSEVVTCVSWKNDAAQQKQLITTKYYIRDTAKYAAFLRYAPLSSHCDQKQEKKIWCRQWAQYVWMLLMHNCNPDSGTHTSSV